MENKIQRPLEALIGLKLNIARRAADMRGFHFGEIRVSKPGTVGEYTLHIQCAWRLDGPQGIVTGRDDYWEGARGESSPNRVISPVQDAENLQDAQLGALFEGYDPVTRSYVNTTEFLIVEKIETTSVGDVIVSLTGGYRLAIFPSGLAGEQWRFFRPDTDFEHLVVDDEGVRYSE